MRCKALVHWPALEINRSWGSGWDWRELVRDARRGAGSTDDKHGWRESKRWLISLLYSQASGLRYHRIRKVDGRTKAQRLYVEPEHRD
jgi:hypothetical protein